MPRKVRTNAPVAFHHIIVRGIERKKIFEDDTDKVSLSKIYNRDKTKFTNQGGCNGSEKK
jgi:hypothetical protein